MRTIARTLGRSPSSVSREMRRNFPFERRIYTSRLAHERAMTYRAHRGRQDRLKNASIRDYVISHLKERWSPEQIAGRMEIDLDEHISHEAIYQFIYARIHQNGLGLPRPGKEDLRVYLRRRKKKRIPKGSRRCQRISRPRGASIDLRPKIVEKRTRVGDWEGDSVESKDHKPGLNTLVERKTGFVFMTRLRDKTSRATVDAITARFSELPAKAKYTLTLDNGPENQDWKALENKNNIRCFFAHPYHSWERGTNENTNGLIRDFFPKKTDFDTISEEELCYVEQNLNTRPRKRLGWQTPLEVMSVALEG